MAIARQLNIASVSVLCITLVGIVLLTVAAMGLTASTSRTWADAERTELRKLSALSRLDAVFGRDGPLHELEHAVRRGGTIDPAGARSSLVDASAAVAAYRETGQITAYESSCLERLEASISQAEAWLNQADADRTRARTVGTGAREATGSIRSLQRLVRDDLRLQGRGVRALLARERRAVLVTGSLIVAVVTALCLCLTRVMRSRILAEHAWTESLAAFARCSTNGMVRTDAARRITWVNAGFEKISGYTLDELVGRTPGEVLQFEETDSETVSRLRTALSRGEGFRGRILNRSKSGRVYWLELEITPERDARGNVTGYLGIESDVTALVDATAAASALAEERAWLSATFERSGDPMVVVDLEGRVRYSNPAAEALDRSLGYALERGGPALLFSSDRVEAGAAERLLEAARRGESVAGRIEVRTGGGDRDGGGADGAGARAWLQVSASPLTGESGEIESVLLIKRDVSLLVEQEQLSRLRTEKAEMRARIGTILAASRPLTDRLAESLAAIAGPDRVGVAEGLGVFTVDRENEGGELVACVGSLDAGLVDEGLFGSGGSGPVGRAVSSGSSVIGSGPDGRGHCVVPLLDGGVCVGVLVACGPAGDGPAGSLRDALEGVSPLLASAIARARQQEALERERRRAAVLAERLSVATESANVGIWEFHPGTGTLIWDATMYRLHGRDPGEPANFEFWAGAVHPDDVERASGEFAAAIEGGDAFDTRFRIIRGDGQLRHIRATATVIRGYDGDVARVIGANWDVTETQNALDSLEESQRVARMGSWRFDPRSGEVTWSDELYRVYGRDPAAGPPSYEDVLGDYDEASARKLDAAVRRAMASGTPYTLTLRTRGAGNGPRYIRAEGRTRVDREGSVVELFGTAMDITEQVEREQSLAALKDRLRLFVAHAPAAIAMCDTEMRYVHVSRGWYEQYGLTGREIIGRSHYEVFPTIPERWKSLHRRALAGETVVSERDSFTRENGEEIWVRYVLCPWRQGDGSVGGMMMFTDVINEQVRHERELEAERDRAEAASRAKSDFLANMSHEIRTPMTAILGYADLLAHDVGSDPEQASEAVRVIRSNASHLLTIINDILDVSKIEAGQLKIERIRTSPVRLVNEACALVEPRVRGKGIGLRVCWDTPVPESVISDPTRLRQILLNLLGNAIKFTERGGVTVRVSYEAERSALVLRVADTGIGMTPEERASIARFEAFTQADASTTRRYGGTGLGLRISNGLASMLGGGLEIDSVKGEGTTITVRVTAERAADARMLDSGTIRSFDEIASAGDTVARASGASSPSLRGVRVLLAEDGPDNMRLISFLLTKAGAEVTGCENGRIAAETVEGAGDGERPDVILMDMQMPELDGYDATRRLRAGGCTIPIIALTAHAMDGDRERCLEAGCDDYLTKPVDRAALIAACRRWADRGGSSLGRRAA